MRLLQLYSGFLSLTWPAPGWSGIEKLLSFGQFYSVLVSQMMGGRCIAFGQKSAKVSSPPEGPELQLQLQLQLHTAPGRQAGQELRQ